MRKWLLTILPLALLIFASAACMAVGSGSDSGSTAYPAAATVMPSATPQPSAAESTAPAASPTKPAMGNLESPPAKAALVKVSGVVKKINGALVLIASAQDGGEFMLRFSENSKWDAGVDTQISIGNTITCMVKLEPTFTTPSQGEVFEVLSNSSAK